MSSVQNGDDVGFTWWLVWSWLCIVIGSIGLMAMYSGPLGGWAIFLVGINMMVGLFMLHYSRAAFLTMTILSLNPLVWIINGIYLKNRWNHPLVIAGSGSNKPIHPVTSLDKPKSADVATVAVSPTMTTTPSNDDYQQAAEEIESGNIDKGLWARLFSEADGDENRTRARYIKERVAMMKIH